MSKEVKSILASYGRSLIAAVGALYMAGVTDPSDLAVSLLAAIAPVAIRYVNPNDPGFGRVPSVEEFEKAVRKATPKKAPAKKKR